MHRRMRFGRRSAFTLIEIVIVIIIVGILAALVGPRMANSIKKARARDAMNNLRIIYAAQQIHNARNSQYYKTSATAPIKLINDINGTNSLNISASSGTAYVCDNTTPPTTCVASNAADGLTVTVTLASPLADSNGNPKCSAGTCP